MSNKLPIALGQVIDLKIEGVTHQGWGIGRFQGFAVFVPGGLPGESVQVEINQVKKSFAVAKIIHIHHQSPHRVKPRCEIHASCGGCQLQHAHYARQLEMKHHMVESMLIRIGRLREVKIHPVLGMTDPWHYRNRVQFHVQVADGRVRIGFFQPGTHQLVSFEECHLAPDIFNKIRSFLERELEKYLEIVDVSQLKHFVLKSGAMHQEIVAVFVTAGKKFFILGELAEALTGKFPSIISVVQNVQKEGSPGIYGPEWKVIMGKVRLEDRIGDVIFSVSPGSFVQVNSGQTSVLYDKVLEYADLQGDETVMDLYCGIGTISLFLAQKAGKVLGIEDFPEAVEDARLNARLNGIENAEFAAGKAEMLLPKLQESGIRPQVIVLDPPRKGCDPAVLEAIAAMKPRKVVYVSCDPATLSRDLKILAEKGYKTLEVQPVDMFPQTARVECVAKLAPAPSLRPMGIGEVKDFYDHIVRDFKEGEYPPYQVLLQQLQKGTQEGIVFTEQGKDLAYAVIAPHNTNRYVLISLLAVLPGQREKGIGSDFLKALVGKYQDQQGIIVEVERPDVFLGRKEADAQRRRIQFYEKAGFYLIPDINYAIWDISMHLMALPILASRETINKEIEDIMTEIYEKLLTPRFSHKMVISRG